LLFKVIVVPFIFSTVYIVSENCGSVFFVKIPLILTLTLSPIFKSETVLFFYF
jgi:hypothetical protein